MKAIKTRHAAQLQLYTGMWWNSVLRTLQLEKARLDVYIAFLDELAETEVWTLNQGQSAAGRIQCSCDTPMLQSAGTE